MARSTAVQKHRAKDSQATDDRSRVKPRGRKPPSATTHSSTREDPNRVAEKFSISLEPVLADWLREQSEASGTPMSTLIADALRRTMQRQARENVARILGLPEANEEEIAAIRAEMDAAFADKS